MPEGTNDSPRYRHSDPLDCIEHPKVRERYDAVPEEETVAITAVTRMEVLGGRMASLLKAADEGELRKATERLQKVEKMLEEFLVLHVDDPAIRHFVKLRSNKKTRKMGRADITPAGEMVTHAGDTSLRRKRREAPLRLRLRLVCGSFVPG